MGIACRGWPWVIALGVFAGCETLGTAKVDNPVIGPAPPRVATQEKLKQNPYRAADSARDSQHSTAEFVVDDAESADGSAVVNLSDYQSSDESSSIDLASAQSPHTVPIDGLDVSQTYVVASVNGLPILADDVLMPYVPLLKKAEAQATPEQMDELREKLIKRDLPQHVEKMILISALKEYLKPDQAESFQQYLDQEFETQLKKIRREMKVETKQELETILKDQGTSIEKLKEEFGNQQMAMQYMAMKSQSPKQVGRQELVDYYRSHQEDYAVPSRVKWQLIIVPFASSLNKGEARAKLSRALDEMLQGKSFEEVAKAYSSGPTAASGGHWGDWTTKGSLADEKLEKLLYELPVGEISAPYESNNDYRIVRVLEREEAGYRPFEDVQFDIEKMLKEKQAKEIQEKVVRELRQTAYIETIYDKPGQPYIRMLLPEEVE